MGGVTFIIATVLFYPAIVLLVAMTGPHSRHERETLIVEKDADADLKQEGKRA